MGRKSRAERIAIWQERLDRYAISNQTVTDFCKNEGIAVPSYYYWKRRLNTLDLDSPAAQQKPRPQRDLQAGKAVAAAFTELVVTGQQAQAQAQLPNGVSISLGSDQAIAAAIIDRLLAYEPPTTSSGSKSGSRSSC